MMDVEVRVPATIANLGPGFDCLGVAIGVFLRMRFVSAPEPRITGRGRIRSVGDSLVYKAFRAAFEAASRPVPTAAIEVLEIYPSARGLGASASAIVGGLVAAKTWGDLDLSDDDLAHVGIDIEGHGDNVLPAMFGGLILDHGKGWLRFEPVDSVSPLVLVAGQKFKTSAARKVLPNDVPRVDAVANAAAAAALVAVLTGAADPESLMLATEDRLHEPYRLPLMNETLDLHTALRAQGIPAALAGAGPSLVCLVRTGDVEQTKRIAEQVAPDGWKVLSPGWDVRGTEVR